mgnify:FL=1
MPENQTPPSAPGRFFANSAIIFFWFAFFYIWGPWGPLWQSGTEVFSPKWWFDTLGHAVVGLVFPIQLLYYYSNYPPSGAFTINDEEKLKLKILWNTAKLAVCWEIFEMVFDALRSDFYNFMDRAQKGSVDTTVDIAVTFFAAQLAMALYVRYKKAGKKRHPEVYAEIESDMAEIALRIQNVFEKMRLVSREQRKEFTARLKIPMKNLARSFRGKK